MDGRDNPNTIKWAGVPWQYRYSDFMSGPKWLLREMKRIDPLLDLKFYLPKEKWHIVRYPHGRSGQFVRVWECSDNPDLGLREGLGSWIIEALKMSDMRGAARNREKEMNEMDEAIRKTQDEELRLQSRDFANEMRKPLQQWHDYGEKSETHFVY